MPSSTTQHVRLSKRQMIINLAVYGSVEGEHELARPLSRSSVGAENISHLTISVRDTASDHYERRLKLAHVLSDGLDDDVELAAVILQDDRVASTRDLALHYGLARMHTLASAREDIDHNLGRRFRLTESGETGTDGGSAASSTSRPQETPSSADAAATTVALKFRRRLFAAEPTAVLQHMVHCDDDINENPSDELPIHAARHVCAEAARFLDSRPDFDIRTTSVVSALDASPSVLDHLDASTKVATVDSLKLLQRVQALTPVPELIRPLLESGFTSGLRVSSLSRKSFVARMAPKLAESWPDTISLGESAALFGQVHDHATAGRLRFDNALTQIREMVRGTGLGPIDGYSVLAERKAMFTAACNATNTPLNVNLDAIFADMDMCECEACLDVVSPTAYYVDLLQYLRNNDLDDTADWHNTGVEGIQGTALEDLFARRPDLQHLQLTCANANTALPMIDLANEVMEAFLIHVSAYQSTGKAKIETWNISRETTDELLASPSHTRKQAYCILKHAVFPLALPYFQPLDAIRLYLSYLGTSRFQLIDTFRLAQRQWVVSPKLLGSAEKKAHYAEVRNQVQDRAAAAEYLSIDPDVYVILTHESLFPMASFEFADKGLSVTEEEYRKDIGVVDPYVYWGYQSEAAMLNTATDTGLSFVKAQFLPRSVLSFADTADLARTRYVNPMMPLGKDRILLNSIRFSYRFLQHLVVGKVGEERIEMLSSFLFCTQAWTHHVLAAQMPPTGNDLVEPDLVTTTFTHTEIHTWVAKWFDCIGKLTVLESGQGPTLDLPSSGYLVWLPSLGRKLLAVDDRCEPGHGSTSGKVIGYLDQTGDIRDSNEQLVGFVWVDGHVYLATDAGHKLASDVYPSGHIYFFPMPKADIGKTPEMTVFTAHSSEYHVDEHGKLEIESHPGHGRPVHWNPGVETCSIAKTRLIHLNGSALESWEWDRINRFVRLYKVMQAFEWTIPQLDTALVATKPTPASSSLNGGATAEQGFSLSHFLDKPCQDETCGEEDGPVEKAEPSPCDRSNYLEITPAALEEIMSIQKLVRHTSEQLERLLCLWTDIDTFGDKSLYARLFLTHDLESVDKVFVPDANGDYLTSEPKIGDHVPVLVAAFHIKAEFFDAILQRLGLSRESKITISNLTKLYRHALFSRILGIRPQELLDVLDLFPQPYEKPSTTLDLVLLWERISNASFTIKQLRYIILDADDVLRPIAPNKFKVLRTAKAIVDGLIAIGNANADLTESELDMLSSAQVRAKALLMFDPAVVEDIVGLIDGTKIFSTNAPPGLTVDVSKAPAKLVYKDPVTPSGASKVTLSVTGCLTDAEMSTALSLFPSNGEWSAALGRLKTQAARLVKRELGQVVGEEEIDAAIKILTQGDVPATTSGETGESLPGTAPAKRAYLAKKLMPYLRSYLNNKLVATTMSAATSLSTEICAWLLEDVIKFGTGLAQQSAMEVLVGLKSTATVPGSGTWSGYLLAPSTDTYVFYGYGNTQPPALLLNGTSVPFDHQNEDPNNLWWTGPVKLIGGKTVQLQVVGQAIPGDLQWKTERSGISQIPSGALVPDTALSQGIAVFAALSKASMVVQGFSLSLDELEYLQSQGASFTNLDFGHISLDAFKRLLAYYELRKTLVSREKGLVDLFKWAILRDTATADEISAAVSDVTTWDVGTIKSLMDATNFDCGDVKMFRDEIALSKLLRAIQFTEGVGIKDVNLLMSWTDLKLDFYTTWELAKSVRKTIRGKYTASDYELAIKPSHNTLRRNQRGALVTYLIAQPALKAWGVTDGDSLFEFFLLDVNMEPCMQTSRTKQAISSAQLFIQRCFLGLEKKSTGGNIVLDEDRWKWMSKQTVWSANRKVFLYPENWLVPSLRDRKTPVYSEMESAMMQRDVKPETILESFRSYVEGLAQVARLRVVGLYMDRNTLNDIAQYILHCVAMTTGAPYLFFHRTYTYTSQPGEWSPWVRITVDVPTYAVEWQESRSGGPIRLAESQKPPQAGNTTFRSLTGCYVTPVAWKTRTFVFIGTLTKKTIPNDRATSKSLSEYTSYNSPHTPDSVSPGEAWEVKLAWTEYRVGKWSQKRTSSDAFLTVDTVMRVWPTGDKEKVRWEKHFLPDVDSFQFLPLFDDDNDVLLVEVWYYASYFEKTVKIDEGTPPLPETPDAAKPLYAGTFIFNGTQILQSRVSLVNVPSPIVQRSFHASARSEDAIVQSLQLVDGEDGVPEFPYAGGGTGKSWTSPYVSYEQDSHGILSYPDGTTTDRFYHDFPQDLVKYANTATENTGLESIEALYRQPHMLVEYPVPVFGADKAPSSTTGTQWDEWTAVFKELSKPYSQYNWELGFHGPMQVAEALAKSQQFDEALEMMHQVFNPHAQGTDIRKAWRWLPFEHSTTSRVLEGILNSLKPRQHDDLVTQWRDQPFQPYVVARGRIIAYMKWTVALYIKTLIAYGDMYFRRRTLEDIPLAIQLYVLASHLYGARGEVIPRQGKKIPQTYFSLLNKWDAFSNAAVQLEIAFPYSNQTGEIWRATGDASSHARKIWTESQPWGWCCGEGGCGSWAQQIGLANLFGFATSRYFCLPNNAELQALRTTIDTRLYNIRNCLDIDGRPMPLALWEPPIDPGQLVAAVASGLSLSSALNDLNASLPNFRFPWLLARALETTTELRGLETTFLSIKEKRDGEALQLLRAGHEIAMNKMVMELKKAQLEEAERTLEALRTSQEPVKHRFEFYSQLAGGEKFSALGSSKEGFKPKAIDIDSPSAGDTHTNALEAKSETLASTAQALTESAAELEVMASILAMYPQITPHTEPFGCGMELVWGPSNLLNAQKAVSQQDQQNAGTATFKSSQVARKVNYVKQYQDRLHQANLAGLEYDNIEKQIATQETRIRIVNQDIENQQQLIDNSEEVNEFLRNKYTNDELYAWLEGGMRTSMYQTYLLAYDLAKKAEMAFRFERRPTPAEQAVDYISFGYFSPARDGLQASQQLYLALKQMDAAYQERRGHDYEITKSVSLRQLNPFALLTLRETGSCTFAIPEVAYDMDFPGHFFRRIKTVSVTVPCVVGPYVGVNASVRILGHRYRADATASSGRDYVEDTSGSGGGAAMTDPRFRTAVVPIDAVAVGTGLNDAGAFELNLRDERYLPFEGAGAISTWQIALPPRDFRPFDYASIADVVLQLRYTACDGGERLRKAATQSVVDWVASVEDKSRDQGLLALWDLRAEFATEWARLVAPASSSSSSSQPTARTMVLRGLLERLPAFVAGRDPAKVRVTDVTLATNLAVTDPGDFAIDFKYSSGGTEGEEGDFTVFDSGPVKTGSLTLFRISETDERFGDWGLRVGAKGLVGASADSRVWMIVRYRLLKPTA